jgi:hypothetical protein
MREVTAATQAYLSNRLEQIRYQTFAAAGYPIGSGCVESANKLVVEARLKGSGMHWHPDQVNPMLALRTVVANRRWDQTWPTLWTAWRRQARDHARARRHRRQVTRSADLAVTEPAPIVPSATPVPRDDLPPKPKTIVNGKPTADHPWRTTAPFRAKR